MPCLMGSWPFPDSHGSQPWFSALTGKENLGSDFKNSDTGASKRAQRPRMLAALAEDLSSLPSTHMAVHISRGSDALFWPSWVCPHMFIPIHANLQTETQNRF